MALWGLKAWLGSHRSKEIHYRIRKVQRKMDGWGTVAWEKDHSWRDRPGRITANAVFSRGQRAGAQANRLAGFQTPRAGSIQAHPPAAVFGTGLFLYPQLESVGTFRP